MRRLPHGEGHFVVDELWSSYVERKLELLESDADRCRIVAGSETSHAGSETPRAGSETPRAGSETPHADSVGSATRPDASTPGDQSGPVQSNSALADHLWAVARLLGDEHPELLGVSPELLEFRRLGIGLGRDGTLQQLARRNSAEKGSPLDPVLHTRVLHHLGNCNALERLADALALTVQEDLVILDGPAAADRTSLIHVCFPSHWQPEMRRGASFLDFHRPVPENERLNRASRNLVGAMLERGPFVRYVWSLTRNPDLDAHPERTTKDRMRPSHGSSRDTTVAPNTDHPLIDSFYLRTERQTTHPLGSAGLFTIRIFVTPLRDQLTPERAATLASAIRSMGEKLLDYKGLSEVRDPLLEELDQLATRGRSPESR